MEGLPKYEAVADHVSEVHDSLSASSRSKTSSASTVSSSAKHSVFNKFFKHENRNSQDDLDKAIESLNAQGVPWKCTVHEDGRNFLVTSENSLVSLLILQERYDIYSQSLSLLSDWEKRDIYVNVYRDRKSPQGAVKLSKEGAAHRFISPLQAKLGLMYGSLRILPGFEHEGTKFPSIAWKEIFRETDGIQVTFPPSLRITNAETGDLLGLWVPSWDLSSSMSFRPGVAKTGSLHVAPSFFYARDLLLVATMLIFESLVEVRFDMRVRCAKRFLPPVVFDNAELVDIVHKGYNESVDLDSFQEHKVKANLTAKLHVKMVQSENQVGDGMKLRNSAQHGAMKYIVVDQDSNDRVITTQILGLPFANFSLTGDRSTMLVSVGLDKYAFTDPRTGFSGLWMGTRVLKCVDLNTREVVAFWSKAPKHKLLSLGTFGVRTDFVNQRALLFSMALVLHEEITFRERSAEISFSKLATMPALVM